jgi:hypothetical protein
MSRPGPVRLRAVAVEFLCIAAVLAPLAAALASDLTHASLWLDEITYHYLENDMALRAAELGRPGSAVAPHLGIFFFCDVQRLLHALVRPLGLTLSGDPELYLRFSSIASYVVATLALYAYLRRRLPKRIDALVGAAAFSSTPIFLHYAFEARVYGMTTMLVVLLVIALDEASRNPSAARLAAVVALGLVTAHSHLWTLCLFGGLLLVAAAQVFRERRLTPWAVAAGAASLPAVALIGAQILYMRATDPGAPLFPPFRRQQGLITLYQLDLSNFLGVQQTQFILHSDMKLIVVAHVAGFALLALAWLSARSRTRTEYGTRSSDWISAAVLSLFFCWALAVGYGYYTHARYHVPLMGALFFAVALDPARPKRIVYGLLIACNVGLLPSTLEAIRGKGNVKEVAEVIRESGRRDLSVVCQHVVSGGFPLPLQAIGLDFYLNVLHPDEPQVRICEKPGLVQTNGRRGVYDLFAGGSPVLEPYLRSEPELWRSKRDVIGPRFFSLEQVWNIEEGNRQNQDFARVMLERGDLEVAAKYYVPGFPRTLLVEVRRKANP